MRYTWRTELPSWLLLAAMFALAAAAWPWAPDRIAVHWGTDFRPDRYGGRFEGLLGIPLLAVGLYVVFLLLPRIDPGRANYPRFAGAYGVLRTAVLAFLAGVYVFVHMWLRGIEVDPGAAVPLMMGVLFVVIGNLFGKIRPNWFVGIRTPWTLSSKAAWVRSHRAGGWVFIGAGLLFLAAALVARPWALAGATGVLLAGMSGVIVYSYLVWRRDPDKTPPAGTTPADE